MTKFRVSTFPPCSLPLTLHNSIVHQHAVTMPRAASRLHIQASLHIFVSDETKASIRSSALGGALDEMDFDEEGGAGPGRKKKTRAQMHAEEEAAAQKRKKEEEEVEKLKEGPPPVAKVEAKARPRQGVAEIDPAGSLERKKGWADAIADGRSDVQGPTWVVELAPGSNVVELAATKPGDEAGKEVYRLFIMRAP